MNKYGRRTEVVMVPRDEPTVLKGVHRRPEVITTLCDGTLLQEGVPPLMVPLDGYTFTGLPPTLIGA